MVTIAIIGTRQPDPVMVKLCRRMAAAFRDLGWELVTGNAKGIDSIARDVWNEKFPERVTLVLPWEDYNRAGVHPANWVVVYSGQGKWRESVEQYHPAPGRLSGYAVKLHARNYGIVELADVVVAFPGDGKEGGGTGQGIRVARALGKKLFVLPGDLDALRGFYRKAYLNQCAASLVEDLESGCFPAESLLPGDRRQRLLSLLEGE